MRCIFHCLFAGICISYSLFQKVYHSSYLQCYYLRILLTYSAISALNPRKGIVNLVAEMKCIVGFNQGKALESNERLGKMCGYADCLTPVLATWTIRLKILTFSVISFPFTHSAL